MIERGSIKQTYNYDMFKFQKCNRDITEKAYRKIEKRYQKDGWLKLPIHVNEKYEVLDGQHRLLFAKNNDLPVYYIVIPGADERYCQVMNSTRTSWNIDDYIKFFAEKDNNESYKKLIDLKNRYDFLTSTGLVQILQLSGWGGNSQEALRDGHFEMTDEDYKKTIKRLDYLKQLSPYVDKIDGRRIALYLGLAFCYECEKIDHVWLAQQVKKRIATITPPINIEWALRELEGIYNYKKRGDHVYLLTEYKKYVQEKARKKKSHEK